MSETKCKCGAEKNAEDEECWDCAERHFLGTACDRPPIGWWCSRAAGHDGPCAAHPVSSPARPEVSSVSPPRIGVREERLLEETETAIASLRAAVVDDNTLADWFRRRYLLEVADLLARLRTSASLGELLLTALQEQKERSETLLCFTRWDRCFYLTRNRDSMTPTTRMLSEALRAAQEDGQ